MDNSDSRYYEGINNGEEYTHSNLMPKFTKLVKEPLVIISAPPASGKTSLFQMFLRNKPMKDTVYYYVKMNSKLDPFEQLAAQANICLTGCPQRWEYPSAWRNKKVILIIDNAQTIYNNDAFWSTLLKNPFLCLPDNLNLVISCTYLLNGPEIYFYCCRSKIEFTEFLLSKEESYQLISDERMGLKAPMKDYPTLLEMIVNDCNGHIGSLRITIDAMNRKNLNNPLNTADKALAFFSEEILPAYDRCWSFKMDEAEWKKYTEEFGNRLQSGVLVSSCYKDDKRIERLFRVGILMDDGCCLQFTSPLAKRYLNQFFNKDYRDHHNCAVGDLRFSLLTQDFSDRHHHSSISHLGFEDDHADSRVRVPEICSTSCAHFNFFSFMCRVVTAIEAQKAVTRIIAMKFLVVVASNTKASVVLVPVLITRKFS
jgi:hypothetical protein